MNQKMTERILEQFTVDDFDGQTAILYGPQGPFQMMTAQWTLTFDEVLHTWMAVSYEDEDDTTGTIEMEGTWDDEGHMFYGW